MFHLGETSVADARDCRTAYVETVSVHLLDDDESVSVLRDTLIFHSGHFAELFEDDPNRRAIVIPEISVTLFTIIECWLRTSSLLLPPHARLSYADMVTIYLFGDTYAMPRLKNSVIDLVFATVFEDQLYPLSALNDIYARTHRFCSLRALLVDIAIAVYDWDDLMMKSELLPKEFLLEVIQQIRGKTVRLGLIMFPVDVWHTMIMQSLCNWHEHVAPSQFSCGDTEPEDSEAERIDSADCESENLDDGESNLNHEEGKNWHSILVIRPGGSHS